MQYTLGYKVRFTVGLEFGKSGCTNKGVAEAIKLARTALAVAFGGFTETLHNGGWISKDDTYVGERGLTFEVVIPGDKCPLVESFADYLRRELDQEQVLVTKEPIEFEFYDGHKAIASELQDYGAGY